MTDHEYHLGKTTIGAQQNVEHSSTPAPTNPPLSTDPPGGGCGTCDWFSQTIPICCNSSSGWGWKNGQFCVSESNCPGNSSTPAPTSPPLSTNPPGGGSVSYILRARGTGGNEPPY